VGKVETVQDLLTLAQVQARRGQVSVHSLRPAV